MLAAIFEAIYNFKFMDLIIHLSSLTRLKSIRAKIKDILFI